MTIPTTFVIFGASGDLTRRKLMPALFDLHCRHRLPRPWRIVGVSRRNMSDEEFRNRIESGVKEFARAMYVEELWAEFAPNLSYRAGSISELEDMKALDRHLARGEEGGQGNRVYHFSVAPRLYETGIANLGAATMVSEDRGWRRVVIEKPFGHDYPSAMALNEAVHEVLEESQVYRIDHYLGKETVQNILVFRFANSLFEPVWNRNYIDHVQITAAETVGIGHRAGYYDQVGVMRDMLQNHVMQLLALVAAEPPSSFDADALRNEKVKVLAAVRPISHDDVANHTVHGQYRGYRETAGVAANSDTATYAAVRFHIDNWRWQGVPFYVRSGKALARKVTSITIYFKRPPHVMFPLPDDMEIAANYLNLCIQPDEGIHFSFQAKVPDTAADMRTVDMSFHYDDHFGESVLPEAYERLLLDVVKGDASLFTRGDAIELSWQLIDPILDACQSGYGPPLSFYDMGSWGPAEANKLVEQHGFRWNSGCE